MISKKSPCVLSLKAYKAVLEEYSSRKKPYSEIGHLHPEKDTLQISKWCKGSRDRGLREDIAA